MTTPNHLTRPFITGLLLMCLVSAGHTQTAAANSTETLQVEGQAVIYQGDRPQAQRRALDEAFNAALTRVMGSWLSAESFTHNFESIDRGVYGRTQGYIKTWKIVTSSEQGELLTLQVQVTVSTEQLKDDLGAMGILLDQLDNPSLSIDGSEQGLTLPQSPAIIRKTLMTKGIRVLNEANPHADIMVELTGHIQNQTEIAAVGMHGAVVKLQANAYWQQERRLLASEHSIANAAAGNAEAALIQAYQQAAERLAPRLLEQLVWQWREQAYNSRLISLSVSGSHAQQRRFTTRLSRVFGVRKVSLKHFQDGQAELSARFTGSASLLAELIARTQFDALIAEITEVGQNRLTLSLLQPARPTTH